MCRERPTESVERVIEVLCDSFTPDSAWERVGRACMRNIEKLRTAASGPSVEVQRALFDARNRKCLKSRGCLRTLEAAEKSTGTLSSNTGCVREKGGRLGPSRERSLGTEAYISFGSVSLQTLE